MRRLSMSSRTSLLTHDRDFLRRLAKQLTDYDINMSTPRATEEYFTQAARITNNDAIICQQYANWLLRRSEFERALYWIDIALVSNPSYTPLTHTKGNVLRGWGLTLTPPVMSLTRNRFSKRRGVASTDSRSQG